MVENILLKNEIVRNGAKIDRGKIVCVSSVFPLMASRFLGSLPLPFLFASCSCKLGCLTANWKRGDLVHIDMIQDIMDQSFPAMQRTRRTVAAPAAMVQHLQKVIAPGAYSPERLGI